MIVRRLSLAVPVALLVLTTPSRADAQTVDRALALDVVALYKALGGGWETATVQANRE